MIKHILACWAVLALLCAASPAASVSPEVIISPVVSPVLRYLSTPGVSVTVEYRACGGYNAYYSAYSQSIIICTEDYDMEPELLRFVVAHEYGHAIIDQLDLPITGSEEEAADEFAAVALGAWGGHTADVMAGALWFAASGRAEDIYDSHQSDRKRALTLACLSDGAEDEPASGVCAYRYSLALHRWGKLLVQNMPKD